MWPLNFISEKDFKLHVKETIERYTKNSYSLKEFNSNIIDPIKLIFDKEIYNNSWESVINDEIYRQKDKSNNNKIGEFHQNIFKYIDNCKVPEEGWDIIYENPDGIEIPEVGKIQRIYVELKNKYNTMNSSSSEQTYRRMQQQLLEDDNCACFLVEVISKGSKNETWIKSIKGERKEHKLIRRVSIDKFYELITGEKGAFYKMCRVLPIVIHNLIKEGEIVEAPEDTVVDELKAKNEESLTLAMLMLAFGDYQGFKGD